MPKKFFLTVTGASLVIIFFGLINKVLGMIREVVFAHRFGLSQSYELYLLSIVIPTVFNTFILYVGQNFFIPQYNKIKAESGEINARIFFNKALALFFMLSLLVTVLIFILMEPILHLFVGGITLSDFVIAKNILAIILLTIPLNGLIAILSSYLQAEFDFTNAYFSQLFLNLSVIIVVLTFTGAINVYSIPIGFLIGSFLQTGYLFFVARRKVKIYDLTHGKVNFLRDFPVGIFITTILIELLGQLYIFIDRLFYQSVEQGGIAALNYATTVYLIPLSIVSMAFSTAIFSKFSETYSAGKILETENSFYVSLRIIFFLFIPATLLLVFYAQPVIELFYHRGAFNAKDVTMTSEVLKIYSVSLVFFAAYGIINKLLFGVSAVKMLLISSILVIGIKVIASLLLVRLYQQNGLAAASTISYFFYFLFGSAIVIRKLHFNKYHAISFEFIISVSSGILSLILVEILDKYIFHSTSNTSLLKIVVFCLLYLINAEVLKDETAAIAKNLYLKMWRYCCV